MSDKTAEQFESQTPKASEAPAGRSITLSITLHPNGQMDFSLPANKVVAYGLLGAAAGQLAKLDVLHDLHQANLKTASNHGINGLLKRMGKGG